MLLEGDIGDIKKPGVLYKADPHPDPDLQKSGLLEKVNPFPKLTV